MQTDSSLSRAPGLWQFVLMLVPFVATGFILVYGLVGWLVEGQSLLRWRYEALEVMSASVLSALLLSGVTLMLARRWGCRWPHPLVLSPVLHGVTVVAVWVMVWLRV